MTTKEKSPRAERSDKGQSRGPYAHRDTPAMKLRAIRLPDDLWEFAQKQPGKGSNFVRKLLEQAMIESLIV